MPILYFGHVLKVLANVDVMLVKLPVEHVNNIRDSRAQSRNIFERIDGQMEPAEFVEDHHVKRSGGRSLIDEATHVKTTFVGAAVNNTVNGPTIAVERKDYRCIARKEIFEGDIVHAVRMVVGTRQNTQVNEIYDSHLDAWYVFLEQPRGGDRFDRGHVAGASQDHIGFRVTVIRAEIPL